MSNDGPLHPAQVAEVGEAPAHWPKGVRPISLEGLSYLGVASDGYLYWDGRPIAVRKTFELKPLQILYALATLLIASIGAGAGALSAYVSWEQATSVHSAEANKVK